MAVNEGGSHQAVQKRASQEVAKAVSELMGKTDPASDKLDVIEGKED